MGAHLSEGILWVGDYSKDRGLIESKAQIIWEILPRLAGAGYLARSRCYGQIIVKLNLIIYEEN